MKIKTFATLSVSLLLHALLMSPLISAKLGNHKLAPQKRSLANWKPPRPGAFPDVNTKTKKNPNGRNPLLRIVGGTDVPSPDVYPFFVSLGDYCGGSLIHSDIVLTAAHCIEILPDFDTVTVNAFKLGNSSTEGAETRYIADFSIHPGYSTETDSNDFMLLKLNETVDTVDPIKLNDNASFPVADQDLTVIGLGLLIEYGIRPPDTLQHVTIKSISDTECSSNYQEKFDPDIMLCAGVEGGGKDACHGDSGGPLFALTSSGKVDKQVGVVSWGEGCAQPGLPGVYAEVSSAHDWILAEICELSDDKPDNCPETPPPDDSVFTLEILTDFYPYETGWHLLDDAGAEVAGVDAGELTLAYQPFVTTIVLEKGEKGKEYTFNITDSSGDGMFFPAYYEVKLGDQIVASGGHFEYFEATKFEVPGTSECGITVNIDCTSAKDKSVRCDDIPKPQEVCSDGESFTSLVFVYKPRNCDQSVNAQGSDFYCEDTPCPPLNSRVKLRCASSNGMTEYFDEIVRPGDVVTISPPPGGVVYDSLNCTVSDMNRKPFQKVMMEASGDSPLHLNNIFGSLVLKACKDQSSDNNCLVDTEYDITITNLGLSDVNITQVHQTVNGRNPEDIADHVPDRELASTESTEFSTRDTLDVCVDTPYKTEVVIQALSVPEDDACTGRGQIVLRPSKPGDRVSCTDNEGTFFVDSRAGNQTCEWLKVNERRYSYLCQFVDVAIVCPDTCNYCEVFG